MINKDDFTLLYFTTYTKLSQSLQEAFCSLSPSPYHWCKSGLKILANWQLWTGQPCWGTNKTDLYLSSNLSQHLCLVTAEPFFREPLSQTLLHHYAYYMAKDTDSKWHSESTGEVHILILVNLPLTLKVLVTTIDAQWEGMGDVGLARDEPELLPPFPTIRILSYSS